MSMHELRQPIAISALLGLGSRLATELAARLRVARSPLPRRAGGRLAAIAAAVLSVGSMIGTAGADDASDPPAATPQSPRLQEVVVTARKRTENLQNTPVSVTAFSGAAMQERGISDIAGIGKFTPNMSFQPAANISGSSAATTVFIRGVGQTDFDLTIDPGVGIYVDGVYVSRSIGGLLDTVDLESVQVLRGPQGTLFGMNTIGGAVVVTTTPPQKTLSGFVEATTGSDNKFDVRGAINIPVTDTLRLRLTGATESQRGYVERLSDGGRMGNHHGQVARLVVTYQPRDRLSFDFSADGTRRREEALPSVLVAVDPSGQFASFWNFASHAGTCFTPPAGMPVPSSPQCYGAQWLTKDPYKTWSGAGNYSDLDLWGTALTVRAGFGSVDVKLISAYRHLNSRFTVDLDGSPLPIDESANIYSDRQWSEELQVTGATLGDRLKWLAGAYFLRETGVDRNSLSFSIADFLSGGSVNDDNAALFTQEVLRLTKRLNLTLGGRYSDETKRFLPDQYIQNDFTGGTLLTLSRCYIRAVPILSPTPSCTADPVLNPQGNRILPFQQAAVRARNGTPSVSLDFRPVESLLSYVSFSRGFKSGGFTQRVFPPEPIIPSFEPEFVDSYEAGVKAQLFDDRLRWNSAVFLSSYKDMQLIVNEGIAPKVRNAGQARIEGFESEIQAAPVERVRIDAGIGFIDAYYQSVPASAAPVTTASRLPQTPRWTGHAGGSVGLWTGPAGALTLRADLAYKGPSFLDAVNSPSLFQGGYTLLSAGLTFDSARGLAVTVGGTNLTNRAYLLSGYQALDSLGATTAAYARPREWYARIRYDFTAH